MNDFRSQRRRKLETELGNVVPLCDVRSCTEPLLCWIDGVAHCELHTELVMERWNAIGQYGDLREYLEPLPYR